MSPIEQAVEFILSKSADNIIVVSNLVWREEQGRYFTISTADSKGEWHVDQLTTGQGFDDWQQAKALREEFITALLTSGRPLVIHNMDDELKSALLCRALWPGERIDNVVR